MGLWFVASHVETDQLFLVVWLCLQSMVGDKTFAFLLMDKEMYFSMSALQEPNLIVDRGIALHKVQ